jgi:hypothetical protein
MTWKRAVLVFLAMSVAGFVAFVVQDYLNVDIYLRGGTAFFAMMMTQRLVARDYVKRQWLGHSWMAWFLSTLAIAIIVNVLMWRFWPR